MENAFLNFGGVPQTLVAMEVFPAAGDSHHTLGDHGALLVLKRQSRHRTGNHFL
jgi:hypothetical protein